MMNGNNFNGWAISEELFNWIYANLEVGRTILELGSGSGTIELTKVWKVYSVEHNEKWLGHAKNSTYIHAPIVPFLSNYQWYSLIDLKALEDIKYDMILVDGPPGNIGREGFLHNLELFDTTVPIIIDDTNRGAEATLANNVAKKLNKKMMHFGGVEKSFVVIK